MWNQITSPVVDATGRTRLQESLERAKARQCPSIGQWLEFPGYTLARTIAPLGEDVCAEVPLHSSYTTCFIDYITMQWVLIDCEHGNIDDSAMYLQVGAIASSGVSPIVRIPASEPWMIKRVLDAGAHGIMVPMCETKVCCRPSIRQVQASEAITQAYACTASDRSKPRQL